MNELVLFGVTGDLAKQKLIPALYSLYSTGKIDKKSSFVGFGRKNFSKAEFQTFIESVLNDDSKLTESDTTSQIRNFSAQWSYIESELDDSVGYKKLASILTTSQTSIYISLPPMYQYQVCSLLISSGIVIKSSKRGAKVGDSVTKETGRKIALEKPYGFDTNSSEKLDTFLNRRLHKDQILRVDHYAGKQALVELEAVAKQGIFKNILSNKTIQKIVVQINESIDVSMRGSFYDAVGALSDVGQNHLLHMLATVLALPESSNNVPLAKLRSEALSLLEISKKPKEIPLLGQYEGFKTTNGVKENSTTETFFRIFTQVARTSQRWGGTPVELIGGKALKTADASIVLYPKIKKQSTDRKGRNKIRSASELKGLTEPIKILVNGYGSCDAYEQIFMDIFEYNPNRFIDFQQIIIGWKFIEKVKRIAQVNKSKKTKKIVMYKKGSYPQDII